MGQHLDVSEVISLMDVSLQNLGSLSVDVNVGHICCVPDDVFMISFIERWRKKRCSTHPRQHSCERDDEGGVFDANSFLGVLFNDG